MRILAPHKSQEGWVYVRVKSCGRRTDFRWRTLFRTIIQAADIHLLKLPNGFPMVFAIGENDVVQPIENSLIPYQDHVADSRVISSRRVEKAVETADFLKLCDDEGLDVIRGRSAPGASPAWYVYRMGQSEPWSRGDTIREAYFRYRATR